jgi:hypothetical protein
MREQINTPINTEQTADIRPLTNAELNEVSGGFDFVWRSGTGEQLWQPLTQDIQGTGIGRGIGFYSFPLFAGMGGMLY